MLTHLIFIRGVVLTGLCSLGFAQASGASTLPSLQAIMEVHGKTTASVQFLRLVRACELKLQSRKQEVLLRRGNATAELIVSEVYGGSGLVVSATSRTYGEGDLKRVTEPTALRIRSIRLIVGPCSEEGMFGKWIGEMPAIELLDTPESLITKYEHPDSDELDVHYSFGVFRDSRRVINYHVPGLGLGFPYAFVFSDNKLAMIEVWPDMMGKVVRPKAPPK